MLISVPFALFGIDSYFRDAGVAAGAVAKVGKKEISVIEFDNALRDQVSYLRQQQGAAFDASVADTRAFREAVLDRLINQQVLNTAVEDARMVVPDAYVQESIMAMPQFQENGQFSHKLYELALSQQGKDAAWFEYEKRKELAMQALLAPVVQSVQVPGSQAQHLLGITTEERTVASWHVDAKALADSVKLAPDAAKRYYDSNTKHFEVPAQLKLEYIVVSSAELGKAMPVTDAEVRKFYDENAQKNYSVAEERRASHILIKADASAKPEEKAAAKKKAEALLAKVKAAPSSFAALAKENSEDKMSAEKGGDLGFNPKGAMVPAFDDALFALKPKEISGIVESQFGFHIIQLTEVKAGGVRPFEEVKAEITAELQRQAAGKRYAEVAEPFANMVFEQPDALKPIADKLNLKLQQTDWVTRDTLPPALMNPKVQAAIFSEDVLHGHRNSEAVDVGQDSVVSVRVAAEKPARTKAFDEVKAEAEALAIAEEAAKLAKTQGEAALAKLQAGQAVAEAKWSDGKAMKRMDPIAGEVRKAVFGASAQKLPAYAGASDATGYTVYRIEKVSEPKALGKDDPMLKQMTEQYAYALGQEDLRAYIQSLRNRIGVKIDENKLMSKTANQ